MIKSEYRSVGVFSSILLAVVWIGSASASNDPVPLRIVALVGQTAPGTSDDGRFTYIDPPVINNAGETAFRAFVAPSGSSTSQPGLWFESAGHLNLAATQGAQPSVDFSDLRFAFNDQAKVAFQTTDGIWSATANGRSPVVRNGDAVPGYPGHTFSSIGRPTMNNDGAIAFSANPYCSNCGIYGEVWTITNGTFSLIAKPPDPYSGAFGIRYFQGSGTPKINAAGRVSLTDGTGVWTNTRGQFEYISEAYTQAPGLPPGVQFAYSSPIVMSNAQGDVVFSTGLYTQGAYNPYDDSIWRYRDGNLRMVLRQGDHAPGLPDGIAFDTISLVSTGDSGDITVFANLAGPGIDQTTASSIWRIHDQNLQLVARSGMQAPGFAPGVTFWSVDSPAMNGRGQVAFRAFLKGIDPLPGVLPVGIFSEDVGGNLQSLVRFDERIDVDPGLDADNRTIKDLLFGSGGFWRGPSDQPFAFNDLGQVAFAVTFLEGGQGIFVTSPLLVPEPTTVPLLAIVAYLLTTSRIDRQRMRELAGPIRCG